MDLAGTIKISSGQACSRQLTFVRAQVQFDFNRNKYFDAHSAKEYGIIDNVLRPPRLQELGML